MDRSSDGRSTRFQPGPRRCCAPTGRRHAGLDSGRFQCPRPGPVPPSARWRPARTPAERPNRAVRDAGRVRITTLGPLAVDGRPVRGTRLAAAVRELVGARGRAVSTAALTRAVWTDDPPDDAPGALQALVSRVRRLGVPVLGVPGGYRVVADQVVVDAVEAKGLAQRARQALRERDAAAARRLADQARSLFPEVPDLADPEAARLFAEVAAVRTEAALAGAGAFEEADLRRLAERKPPDEPSVALLVRALAA